MASFGRRLDGPGGRRTAPRKPVLLSAALMSVGCSRSVILIDLSKTGAHVQVRGTLAVGQQVWIKTSPVEVFGTVAWVEGEECGIRFDEPLDDAELGLLQAKGAATLTMGFSPDERLAGDDWTSGFAR